MKGKQKGRPTKWVLASIQETIGITRTGIKFEVWEKWKRKNRKLGTLSISVGGLRWWPQDGKRYRKKNWGALSNWFSA